MAFNSFVNMFTNSPIQPTDVSYLNLTFDGADQNVQLEWVFQNPATLYPFTQFIQVTGTGTNTYGITMPNALYSSTIQSTIIYNQSAMPIIVYNFSGTNIGTCQPNQAYFFGNTDNTTAAGNWNVFITLGAGSSSVIASSLIDPTFNSSSESNSGGLGAFGAYLKLNTKIYDYSETQYFGNSSDRGTIVTWTGGSGNLTLALSSSAGIGNGFITGLQNRSTTGGIINVFTMTPDSLNNLTAYNTDIPAVIQLQPGDSTFFITNGEGNWYTFGYNSNAQYAIKSVSYSLATSGGTIAVSTSGAANQIQTFQGTYGQSPYPIVNVTFPLAQVQQYFINNLSTTNSLSVSILNETASQYIYTVLPGAAITTFTDGTHLYLSPNLIVNQNVYLPNGTQAAPSLTFTENKETGFYLDETNSCCAVTTNDSQVVAFKEDQTISFVPIVVPTTSIAYTFNGNDTTGLQFETENQTLNTYVDGDVVSSLSNTNISLTCTSTLNLNSPNINLSGSGVLNGTGSNISLIGGTQINLTAPTILLTGTVNTPTYSYQQAGISIYSIVRAYGI